MLSDRFFDLPRTGKAGLDHEAVAGVEGDGGGAVGGDGDLAVDQVDEFVEFIGRVPCAGGCFPRTADDAAIDGGVLHPCLHGGLTVDLHPAVEIGRQGFGAGGGKAEDHVGHDALL